MPARKHSNRPPSVCGYNRSVAQTMKLVIMKNERLETRAAVAVAAAPLRLRISLPSSTGISAAAEYAMAHSYLDWLAGMPWDVTSAKEVDLVEAERILDEDHYDLDRVKTRILEYLAVVK